MTAPIFPLLRRPRVVASKLPWTPASISGLVGWWDASDTATITASSGAVSQWDDLGSNGYHLTQATGSLQPTTGTRTINGLNIIDFNVLTPDALAVTFGTTYTQPITVFTVHIADGGYYVVDGVASGNRLGLAYFGGWFLFAGSVYQVGSPSTGVEYITATTFNGASSVMRANGATLGTTGDAGSHSLTGLTVGNRWDNGGDLNGGVGEVIVYNASLSTTDRDAVESYLNTKWAVY